MKPVPVALGLARDDAHGAAERVLAEQRALRAAQHLDALDVEQVQDGALRTAVVDVVDVDRHAGLERQRVVAQADAANERGGRRAPAGAERRDDRVRHERVEIERARRAARFEHVARERRDRERRLLQVLFAEPCRDDDFLESLLREHARGQRRAKKRWRRRSRFRCAVRASARAAVLECHVPVPLAYE